MNQIKNQNNNQNNQSNFKRGDVVWVDLGTHTGTSIQDKTRPAILISNDKSLRYSPVVHIVPLTGQWKKNMPTHVAIKTNDYPVDEDSIAMCEQTTLISKNQITSKKADFSLTKMTMFKINIAIIIQFGLTMFFQQYDSNDIEVTKYA